MNAKRNSLTLALALFTLVLPATGSTKNPVERPIRIQATVTWIIRLSDGSAIGHETGVGTHVGQYSNEAVAQWAISETAVALVSAAGVTTAANGDELSWKLPGHDFTVEMTKGTGRFAGLISGGMNVTWQSEPIIEPGPEIGTISFTISYIAVGMVSY